MIQAVQQHGMALQYADHKFRKDKDVRSRAARGEVEHRGDRATQTN